LESELGVGESDIISGLNIPSALARHGKKYSLGQKGIEEKFEDVLSHEDYGLKQFAKRHGAESIFEKLKTASKEFIDEPKLYDKAMKWLKQEFGKTSEYQQLQSYRNMWHERIIKEEIKRAAQGNKTKLQFPTGETAMKIEGIGGETRQRVFNADFTGPESIQELDFVDLKLGMEVKLAPQGRVDVRNLRNWTVTDILENGNFRAIQSDKLKELYREIYDDIAEDRLEEIAMEDFIKDSPDELRNFSEQFNISDQIDISNPIYKFYEKTIQDYLKKIRPQMKRITDEQGIDWFEVEIKKSDARAPIEAFGLAGLLTKEDEEEN